MYKEENMVNNGIIIGKNIDPIKDKEYSGLDKPVFIRDDNGKDTPISLDKLKLKSGTYILGINNGLVAITYVEKKIRLS